MLTPESLQHADPANRQALTLILAVMRDKRVSCPFALLSHLYANGTVDVDDLEDAGQSAHDVWLNHPDARQDQLTAELEHLGRCYDAAADDWGA